MTTLRINCGGGTQGRWQSETGLFTGGSIYAPGYTGLELNEPQRPGRAQSSSSVVYGSMRYSTAANGQFSYTITGLTPSAPVLVRVHAIDNGLVAWEEKVQCNGVDVIPNYVVVTDGGALNHVSIKEFTANADGSGQIVVNFVPATGKQAACCALEVHQPPIDKVDKIVLAGDSITDGGLGANNWSSQLATDWDANEFRTNWTAVNTYDETRLRTIHRLAQSGTGWVIQLGYLPLYVTKLSNPEYHDSLFGKIIVFALIGHNDINNFGRTAAQIKADIDTWHSTIAAMNNPNIIQIIAKVLPSTAFSVGETAIWNEVNQYIADNTNGFDYVVDLAALNPNLANAGNTTYFHPDGIHPNAAGHTEIKNTLKPIFEAWLGEPPVASFTIADVDAPNSCIPDNTTTGGGNTYEWELNGTVVSTAFEPELQAHYIDGVNTLTLTATNVLGTDSVTHTFTVGHTVASTGTQSYTATLEPGQSIRFRVREDAPSEGPFSPYITVTLET